MVVNPEVEIASSPEDFSAMYRLRYEVYCEEIHTLNPADYPDREEKDIYDSYSIHIIAKIGSEVIGTMRLIQDNPHGFLMEKVFSLPKFIDRLRAVEHSRAIVQKTYRKSGVFELLLQKAYEWQRANGFPTVLGTAMVDTIWPILSRRGYLPLTERSIEYNQVRVLPVIYYLF